MNCEILGLLVYDCSLVRNYKQDRDSGDSWHLAGGAVY